MATNKVKYDLYKSLSAVFIQLSIKCECGRVCLGAIFYTFLVLLSATRQFKWSEIYEILENNNRINVVQMKEMRGGCKADANGCPILNEWSSWNLHTTKKQNEDEGSKHLIIRFAYNLTILLQALELIHKSMCTMRTVPFHSIPFIRVTTSVALHSNQKHNFKWVIFVRFAKHLPMDLFRSRIHIPLQANKLEQTYGKDDMIVCVCNVPDARVWGCVAQARPDLHSRILHTCNERQSKMVRNRINKDLVICFCVCRRKVLSGCCRSLRSFALSISFVISFWYTEIDNQKEF